MSRRPLSMVVGIALAFGVAGCGSKSGNIFGFEKSAPDEFAIVKRAPLTLPPDYGLRPPRPGLARPQAVSPRDEAQQSLLGSRVKPKKNRRQMQAEERRKIGNRSGGEVALLKRTGAIREIWVGVLLTVAFVVFFVLIGNPAPFPPPQTPSRQ